MAQIQYKSQTLCSGNHYPDLCSRWYKDKEASIRNSFWSTWTKYCPIVFSYSKTHFARNALSILGSKNNLAWCVTSRTVRGKLLLSSFHIGKGSEVRNVVSQVVIYGTFPIFCVISENIWDSILGKAISPPYHKELSSFIIHNWGKTGKSIILFS